MRRCILVCFLLLAGTALAGAAELPLKAPPLIPFTWTGFFIGAHGGFGHGHTRFYDNFPVPDGELDADTRTNGLSLIHISQPIKPPGADPHAGWCGRGRGGLTSAPLCRFYENATRGAVLSDLQCPKYFNDSCQKNSAS